MRTTEPTKRFVSGLLLVFGGALLGLGLSKYSAGKAYSLGYEEAKEKYAMHYKHQVKLFERHRDQSCMAYWFGDNPSRVAEARRWMCQYTNKNERLR
jgi:hypothetical protein